jgi:hypothetical protein
LFGRLLETYGWQPDAIGDHFDWLFRKDFKTPDEWLGEEHDGTARSHFKLQGGVVPTAGRPTGPAL